MIYSWDIESAKEPQYLAFMGKLFGVDFDETDHAITGPHFDGLLQVRRNSIANALELRLSCTKTSILCKYLSSMEIFLLHLCARAGFLIADMVNISLCCVSPLRCRADTRFAPSQWETALLCNDVSHWLGASLESALRCDSFWCNSVELLLALLCLSDVLYMTELKYEIIALVQLMYI